MNNTALNADYEAVSTCSTCRSSGHRNIGVAKGCRGCRYTPRATEKFFPGIFLEMRGKWG